MVKHGQNKLQFKTIKQCNLIKRKEFIMSKSIFGLEIEREISHDKIAANNIIKMLEQEKFESKRQELNPSANLALLKLKLDALESAILIVKSLQVQHGNL